MNGGWRVRSRQLPDGTVQRWHERPKPGCPGVLECRYIDPIDRYSAALGTARLTYGRTTMSGGPPAKVNVKPKPTGPPVRRMTGDPCIEVVMHERALDSIKHAAFWKSDMGRVETGGFLGGTWTGEQIHVTQATSSDAEQTPHSLVMDPGGILALDDAARWGIGYARVGCWHLHPDSRDWSWQPSETDFEAWEAAHQRITGRDRFEPYTLGLIATPDERGSVVYPVLRGWATRLEDGRFVTDPVRITAI